MNTVIACLLGALLLLPTLARAQDWSFAVSPYLWFAGVEGDVSSIPGSPVVPIDISPNDALDDTEASFMVVFEARKGHHGVVLDALYTDVRSEEQLVPEIDLNLKSTSKNEVYSAAYLYEFHDRGPSRLGLLAGARYWGIETILSFRGGFGALADVQVKNKEEWVDPFLGARGRLPLGNSRFYLAGWAAAGGFGVGSDMFYDFSVNGGFQWNRAIGTTLGYRIFDVDYDDDGFVYDVEQAGWVLGLTWSF